MLPQFLRPEAFQVLEHSKGLLPCLTHKSVSCSESREHEKEPRAEGQPMDLFITGSRGGGGTHPSSLRTQFCSFLCNTHSPSSKVMDRSGVGLGARKDPSPAKWSSPARWGPGSLRGYTVVAGPDGRESDEAGYRLQGDLQDPHAAPAVGGGTRAQPPAASEG